MRQNDTGMKRNEQEWYRNIHVPERAGMTPNKAEYSRMNLKMPKFGVFVSATNFWLFQSAFVVSCDSLRELHVLLPFVTIKIPNFGIFRFILLYSALFGCHSGSFRIFRYHSYSFRFISVLFWHIPPVFDT